MNQSELDLCKGGMGKRELPSAPDMLIHLFYSNSPSGNKRLSDPDVGNENTITHHHSALILKYDCWLWRNFFYSKTDPCSGKKKFQQPNTVTLVNHIQPCTRFLVQVLLLWCILFGVQGWEVKEEKQWLRRFWKCTKQSKNEETCCSDTCLKSAHAFLT